MLLFGNTAIPLNKTQLTYSLKIALGFPDEFLIKDSWRKVYFRDILHYLTAYEGFTPDQQYDITYESKRALDMVIETILDVLKRLDFENSASNLKGLFNKRSELLVRRLMDLLGICFCNIKEPCGLYALPGSLDARIIEVSRRILTAFS